jgi:alkyl hydroperoxide reductase subunit AhpC
MHTHRPLLKVFYADLFGKREDKYGWLDRNRINDVKWQELKPVEPYFFFIPKDFSFQSECENFQKATDIFKKSNVVCATGKDKEFVSFSVDKFKNLNKSLIKE